MAVNAWQINKHMIMNVITTSLLMGYMYANGNLGVLFTVWLC